MPPRSLATLAAAAALLGINPLAQPQPVRRTRRTSRPVTGTKFPSPKERFKKRR